MGLSFKNRKIHIHVVVVIVGAWISILLLSATFVPYSSTGCTSYIEHPIHDRDSLSSNILIECIGDDSLPVWYARDVVKVVCSDSVCKLARIRLFWNIRGEYLRFEVPVGEPLTKLDHVPFTKDDYRRLDEILKDSLSIFRNMKEKDLVIKAVANETTGRMVDGYTSATTPSLRSYAIPGAIYTCYTLWHSVYGTISEQIKQIERDKVNPDYLTRLFKKENELHASHAISLLKGDSWYQDMFQSQVINLIKSQDEKLSRQALHYFSEKQLSDTTLQKELMSGFEDFSYQRKFELLWKLADVQQINDEVILQLLILFEEGQINASLLGYCYKLIRKDNLGNPTIQEKLNSFLQHDNLYVRNITQKLITETK